MAKKISSMGGRSFKTGISKKSSIEDLLSKAQETQGLIEKEMEALDGKLEEMEVEATSGGGVLKVVASGTARIKDIVISEELKDEDMDTIKDMIIAATNEVIEKARELKETESDKITQKYLDVSGLNLGI